jgi:hypothetical protein
VLAEPSERALEALAGRVVREPQALAGLALVLVQHQHREQQLGVGADDRLEPRAQDRDVVLERQALRQPERGFRLRRLPAARARRSRWLALMMRSSWSRSGSKVALDDPWSARPTRARR